MQPIRAIYTDKVNPRKSFFRRDVKANHHLKTTGRQKSSDSGLRNDVKAIQNLITIGRHLTATSEYNNSPTQNILKLTHNY